MSHKDSKIRRERRKQPRAGVQIWAVEKNDNSRYFHLVTNLNLGGLFLEKKLPFQEGAIVNLDLELDGEIIPLRGKVVNNYKNTNTNRTGAGVQFIEMDEKIKARINYYLNGLQKV